MRSPGMLNQVVRIVTTVHQKINCIWVINLLLFFETLLKKLSTTYSMTTLFCDVTSCSLAEKCWRFKGTDCFHHQGRQSRKTTETAGPSVTSIHTCKFTWRHISKDKPHSHEIETLKHCTSLSSSNELHTVEWDTIKVIKPTTCKYKYMYTISINYYMFRRPTGIFRNPCQNLNANGALYSIYYVINIKYTWTL
jgi:hypothetical protein